MAQTPNLTRPSPPRQQMDRPQDPAARAAMDRDAGKLAMESEHHAFAGAAEGVGSVEFDDAGAWDIGAGSRPVAPRGDGAAVGGQSHDPGDDVGRDRIRAGGLAPGDTGGDAPAAPTRPGPYARDADAQGPRPDGSVAASGARRAD